MLATCLDILHGTNSNFMIRMLVVYLGFNFGMKCEKLLGRRDALVSCVVM